jgi:hypothetical protein
VTDPFDTPAGPEKKNTVRTRGGVTGHNVRYVLGFGLAGVIVAFLAIWIYFSMGRQPNDISVTPTPEPQSQEGH